MPVQHSVLNVKVQVCSFNQEKALVLGDCEILDNLRITFVSSSTILAASLVSPGFVRVGQIISLIRGLLEHLIF